ncbi:iron-containing alcohol dehydrogenase [Zongyangia hominis]|uniref:Iron-containing alcohol dehydrogenase n=1 Tax=Zongyangia hominis TaxID=2763677 RepID=A0A926EDH5_9FIRM|nr:iron-containing alcohol dehydrogenase [Zongyangia hominis]MBC8570409.1 iron-containing alcohol dehydrogenase [Zongyangia hominis]
MVNFNYCNPARIIFGKDTERELPGQIEKYGHKVLLHYGGGSIKKTGLYDKIVGILNEAGIPFVELGGVQPNPRLSLVYKGIELCRKEDVDFILAVGGGSTIDSAKAIAIGVPYDGDVWDFFDNKLVPHVTLPVASVLTIPAAGSESSDGSVITNDTLNLKHPASSEEMIPKFTIMNPENTFSLPPYQTACGATDIMAHLMERYFTTVGHVDVTDRLIEGTFRTMLYNTPKVLRNPNDYDARAEVMWAGTVAHNNLFQMGRIPDWGSHNIEHELSAIYDIAHGAGLAIVFPAWMKYVYKTDIKRFVQYAVRMFDVDLSFADDEEIALEGIRRLESFSKSIGMPTRLSDIGIGDERIDEMAEKAVMYGPLGNFKPLYKEDVAAILRLAL